jgi:hypothetical protein
VKITANQRVPIGQLFANRHRLVAFLPFVPFFTCTSGKKLIVRLLMHSVLICFSATHEMLLHDSGNYKNEKNNKKYIQ